jgi:uncharacterized protein (TIGR03086 family)
MSEIILTGWNVLDEAREMLRAAVAGVGPDGWSRPTPCTEWTVAQVLQHAALDQRVWGAALAGKAMPGENPFAPSGQLGADPLAYTDEALEESAPAWSVAGAATVPTPLPQGEMPPADAAGAAALDAAIHAWDIALATGRARRSPRPWPGRCGRSRRVSSSRCARTGPTRRRSWPGPGPTRRPRCFATSAGGPTGPRPDWAAA